MSLTIDVRLPSPPARPDESHKGTFGTVLIAAGSRGMSGAAALAGQGALRGGAGLVYLAVPIGIQPIVASIEPSYLTVGLPEDSAGRLERGALKELLARADAATAVAIGPGWGTSPDLVELASTLYTNVARPLVVDADALNALTKPAAGLPAAPEGALRVLTPHPGEFARLTKTNKSALANERETRAAEFALSHKAIVVLKGHRTVITDGNRVAINTTGNNGLATGGTGDVLTGLITALLAAGMPAFEAAHLAAHLHGLAGDLAAGDLSRPGLIASDLPRYLGKAWQQFGAR
jgi:ADP-dependent NAD(P)H-hydrate dehydratase